MTRNFYLLKFFPTILKKNGFIMYIFLIKKKGELIKIIETKTLNETNQNTTNT